MDAGIEGGGSAELGPVAQAHAAELRRSLDGKTGSAWQVFDFATGNGISAVEIVNVCTRGAGFEGQTSLSTRFAGRPGRFLSARLRSQSRRLNSPSSQYAFLPNVV